MNQRNKQSKSECVGQEPLLAKSQRDGRDILTLQQHLFDTEHTARLIFDKNQRWFRNLCRFFKIQGKAAQEKFLLNLRVAALFHDLGKANKDFQQAVSIRIKPYTQTLRHEHLSALILQLPEIQKWLRQNPELDLDIISAAVLSHHLKASESGERQWCQSSRGTTLQLYLQHPEVKTVLEKIRAVAKLEEIPPLPTESWSASNSVWGEALKEGIKAAKNCRRSFNKPQLDPESNAKRALLLATKAGVIVADSAASALVREGKDFDTWIKETVYTDALTPEKIESDILIPSTEEIKRQRNSTTFELRNFQKQTAKLGKRALLITACGSGKTRAGFEWLKEQSKNYDIGKIVFLYPTRATALEGFKGYISWAPEDSAAHLTGTSEYELKELRENPDDNESTKDKDFQLSESEARLYALAYWSRRYFSATVDQFLSFMEHNYRAMCLLPVLADAAVVIDEVHSFDRRMFDDLIAFLQTFDVPVLCMTATLPKSRKEELRQAGLKIYPTLEDRAELEDLEEQESHPRYRLEFVSKSTAFDQAKKAFSDDIKDRKRVLWVVNQVERCQKIADELATELGIEVISYHSQFTLQDRQKIHKKTVAAFSPKSQDAVIAVTTQVCEMSLDLDADILITELAPISSLVQRFGRANRHRARGDKFRATLLVYEPEKPEPYTDAEIKAAKAFIDDLDSGDLSQRQLAEKLEEHALREPMADGKARFLVSGYYAIPGNLRDIKDIKRPCILDGDRTAVENCIKNNQPWDGYVIDVPKYCQFANFNLDNPQRPDKLPKYFGIADSNQYCSTRGFYAKGKK
ncbi:MAG TPA: CRISPR-associated helicase/endonuclease Cas3 [Cyanobacteria bacterium UBA11371]|nr:CRISPR-associated helicase/endonuclease Cas3 [Cyanobacteria bacterium UBA11371]HBE33647.1 CRISPR-associated helicase/endonuclease Cas3 [Cyanobacteria bacterium UBA11368]